MTPNEFFKKIRRGRKWNIEWDGKIRCADGRCPLGAADTDLVDVPSAFGASKLLGLPLITAKAIASGADRVGSRHRPWLLKKLGINPDA